MRFVTSAAKCAVQALENTVQRETVNGFTKELRRTKPHTPIRLNNEPLVGLPHSSR